MKKITLTGGGTAGHVTPNIALIEALRQGGWQIDYIGSKDGVEKNMIKGTGIPYHVISSGKLRRYFSWQNFMDPFKILWGTLQACFLLRRLKVDVVFSKGGFVAFPVVVGAWLNHIPVVAHESDLSPGLANRLSLPFVRKICVTFAGAKQHFKHPEKIEVTGTPLREMLFHGSKEKGLAFCGFDAKKPCLLVMGGSQGASSMNDCLRKSLDTLSERFYVIHLCGRGKVDAKYQRPGYLQLEYAQDELADLFAASDLVLSRAGSNSLYEILALHKPHVLIPLSRKVSRGDQIHNARYFQEQGISIVLDEDTLTPKGLIEAVEEAMASKEERITKIKALDIHSATENVVRILQEMVHVEPRTTVS